MSLTNSDFLNAKPKEKNYKITDGDGLYMLVTKAGKKYWRFDYRFMGKRKTIAFGVYPKVTLKEARFKLYDAKLKLDEGVDPSMLKKMNRLRNQKNYDNNFESVANAWYLKFKDTWSDGHGKRVISYLRNDVFPWLGSMPINLITPQDIIPVIERVSNRGSGDAAKRVKGFIQQVFDYSVTKHGLSNNPAKEINLAMILPPRTKKHYPTIVEPLKIGELLRAIDAYGGGYVVKAALKITPHVMLRPGELRKAEWQEIDFDSAEWKIEVRRRKARKHIKEANLETEVHIVPLSIQVITMLKELKQVTGNGKYIFPSGRGRSRPMSDNAVRTALRAMGYSNEDIVPHGFRHMASTLLNESGKWNSQAIERQLSHKEKNEIKGAYDHSKHLEVRRKMMQYWSDQLDLFMTLKRER